VARPQRSDLRHRLTRGSRILAFVPSRIAFVANPTSGKGRNATAIDVVARRLGDGGAQVDTLVGASADESTDLIRGALASRCDALVVMGGDGMVHLAIQELAGTNVPLGVIPTGTGNDVSRYLGLPRRNVLDAADIVTRGTVRRIDLGRAGSTYFGTVLAAGFDSLVNERANQMTWPKGQMRYNLATLAELRVFRPIHYTMEIDGAEQQLEAMLIAVGNGPSYGGGLRMCEGAELDDGELDVVAILPISKLELIKVYPKLFKGTHVTHPAYTHHRVKRISIAAPGVAAYADGERLGELPITVEVAASALSVFVPPR
jgi:diacylglycerol kinase (ATP)